MAIYRQLLLRRDLRPAAGQIEDKDVTLHDCGVMEYTRSPSDNQASLTMP
jgi:hypothetical protein